MPDGARPNGGDASGDADAFTLNGETHPLPADGRLGTLLESLQLRAEWVLVELNGEPVTRERYPAIRIAPGDHVELATPMAGG